MILSTPLGLFEIKDVHARPLIDSKPAALEPELVMFPKYMSVVLPWQWELVESTMMVMFTPVVVLSA